MRKLSIPRFSYYCPLSPVLRKQPPNVQALTRRVDLSLFLPLRSHSIAQQLRMFQAIMNDDSQALRDLSRLWSSDGMLSARALLCLDALFSIMADQVVSGSEDPSTLVALLRGYISRLRSVMSSRTGAQAMETRRRLFSIKQEGQHYILTGGTFVYTLARKRGMPTTKHNGAPVIQVIHNLLDPLIVEGLRRRLENRLNSILAKCGDAGTFTPSQDMLNGTHSARDEELALGRCIQLNMEMVEVISLVNSN